MTLLLSTYSISWCQNKQDSVLVSIDVIRVANAKMIELKYEKEINNNLIEIIKTDSILIQSLETNIEACVVSREQEVSKYKKQRNIAIGAGSSTSIILLVLLILAL